MTVKPKLRLSFMSSISDRVAPLIDGDVEIEGIDSGELSGRLRKRYGIVVTPIKHSQFEGIRVSPSVYKTPDEIDRFSAAMERVVRDGLDL